VSNPDEDERLLAVAGSVSNGSPVDWNVVRQQLADSDHAAIVDELQRLHDLAAAHSDMSSWGSLHILEALGHGSFATVYRAFDEDLQREVALKISRAQESSPLDPQRAVAEARLLAQVQHANVVTVFDAHRRDDAVALEMQLIEGETLEEIVRRQGPFSAEETARIGLDLCRAVAAVHKAGLIHGDIKAHNVMREKGGRIVLMDFGTGRNLKGPVPPQSDFAGTPLYLAPEVFAGHARTKASDIYSLGVLLFYLSTATYPVWGATRTEVGREHKQPDSRRRLRDVRPDLPAAFIRVVDRALSEEAARRYQTAGEFEAALGEIRGSNEGWPTAALAATVVLAVTLIGTLAYFTFRPAERGAETNPTPSAAPPPQPVVDSPYRVEAAFYRVTNDGPKRLQPTDRLAPNDELYLQLQTSVPSYVYVVNEDDHGSVFLLYPLPGQTTDAMPATVPHRLPGEYRGEEKYWQVNTAGGREHFVIFVSPNPLRDVQQLVASLPAPRPDATVNYAMLSGELVSKLRGVGGLVSAPASPSGPRLSAQYTTPLQDGPEEVRGVWIRQATFENPGR